MSGYSCRHCWESIVVDRWPSMRRKRSCAGKRSLREKACHPAGFPRACAGPDPRGPLPTFLPQGARKSPSAMRGDYASQRPTPRLTFVVPLGLLRRWWTHYCCGCRLLDRLQLSCWSVGSHQAYRSRCRRTLICRHNNRPRLRRILARLIVAHRVLGVATVSGAGLATPCALPAPGFAV